MFQQEESEVGLLGGGNGQLWTLGLGLLATAFAAAYVTRLAKVISLLSFVPLPPQTFCNLSMPTTYSHFNLADMKWTHNHEIDSISPI